MQSFERYLTQEPMRLDKWLWCVRLFKTRQASIDGCRLKRVLMHGQEVKPSRIVQIGDVYEVQQEEFHKTIRVLAMLTARVAGALVPHFYEDQTPPEIYAKQRAQRESDRLAPPVAPAFRPDRRAREKILELFAPPEEE